MTKSITEISSEWSPCVVLCRPMKFEVCCPSLVKASEEEARNCRLGSSFWRPLMDMKSTREFFVPYNIRLFAQSDSILLIH